MTIDRIFIWGAGGHAVSIADVAASAGLLVEAFIDPEMRRSELLTRPVISNLGVLESGTGYFVAIGANEARERVTRTLQERFTGIPPVTLIHRTAVIGSNSAVGHGSVIHAGAVVGAGALLGSGSLINTGAILDHESEIGDFSSLAPGAIVGGRCSIGARSAISMGAIVKHGVHVGSDTIVGAASFVDAQLPDQVVAYGIPARVVRKRSAEDSYL